MNTTTKAMTRRQAWKVCWSIARQSGIKDAYYVARCVGRYTNPLRCK